MRKTGKAQTNPGRFDRAWSAVLKGQSIGVEPNIMVYMIYGLWVSHSINVNVPEFAERPVFIGTRTVLPLKV